MLIKKKKKWKIFWCRNLFWSFSISFLIFCKCRLNNSIVVSVIICMYMLHLICTNVCMENVLVMFKTRLHEIYSKVEPLNFLLLAPNYWTGYWISFHMNEFYSFLLLDKCRSFVINRAFSFSFKFIGTFFVYCFSCNLFHFVQNLWLSVDSIDGPF